jgi:hypothetical protein
MAGDPEERFRTTAAAERSRHAPELTEEAPLTDSITDYDKAHFAVYLSLLHASGEGTSDDEMCRVILGIDPAREPERARKTLQSHLRRARWMSESGYRHLLTD